MCRSNAFLQKDTKNLGYGCYAEALSVAIEHEHKWSTAYEEMNKLSIIDAPLKVLVTYPDTDAQRNELLARLAGMLVKADTFGDFATRRRHMVVLGGQGFVALNVQARRSREATACREARG